MIDILIIGGGVSGAACARELAKYDVKVVVLEKASDVCEGTSKANSGIVHAGYDAIPGTLKAKLNVRGNELIRKNAKILNYPFKQIGSLVVCRDASGIDQLYELYQRGIANGVEGLQVMTDRDEIFKMESNLPKDTVAVLVAKTAGIICPFDLNLSLAENAADNGVEFKFNQEVREIKKEEDYFVVTCENQEYKAKNIINAAGIHGDQIHNMINHDVRTLTARTGEYLLLDHTSAKHVNHVVFAMPSHLGKGILVTPTVHDNLIVGPTAKDIVGKEETQTTLEGIETLKNQSLLAVEGINYRDVITTFCGIRALSEEDDFIIEESTCENFYNAIGISSPGLSACMAIGEMLTQMIVQKHHYTLKKEYRSYRKGFVHFSSLGHDEKQQLIQKDARYANIICRCEVVSEAQIIDALNRPLAATTVDGIKRRLRPTSGRCQGGFCTPKILEIMQKELDIPLENIYKSSLKSWIIKEREESYEGS